MTREQMLELIENSISPCNSTYKDHRKKTANRVLEVIEDAGMLPPKRNDIYIHSTYGENSPMGYYTWENDNAKEA